MTKNLSGEGEKKCNCNAYMTDEYDICVHCFLPKHFYEETQTIKVHTHPTPETKRATEGIKKLIKE